MLNHCKSFLRISYAFLLIGCPRLLADEAGIEFFEKHIRPVLVENCYECHSATAKEMAGGLSLETQQGLMAGGDSGKSVDIESPAKSLLLNALRHQDLKMPPNRKLPDHVVQAFEQWIAMGAPDPRTENTPTAKAKTIDWSSAKEFWSFRPRQRPELPPALSSVPLNPIDAFIAAQHRLNGLHASRLADKATWIRRVYLDLIGIPPSVNELEDFVGNSDPDCYEQAVEQLLASPAYGERWGRHWLDLARYSDSNGADENHRYPNAWRYRDYVVDAYNRDLSFDQFIVEQLAGDLLEVSNESDRRRKLTATGFLVIAPKMLAEQDKPKLVADLVDEQIDTVGKVFLGMTLGCARCHDHKFDPITANDYYALAGIFHSTQSMEHLNHVAQWNEREIPDSEQSQRIARHQEQLRQKKEALDRQLRQARERFLIKQLHAMAALMHLQVAGADASSTGPVVDKWKSILVSPSVPINGQDPFYAWYRLLSLEGKPFAEQATGLWPELSGDTFSSVSQMLGKLPPPKSANDLIGLYVQVLEVVFAEVLDAPRNSKGEIESKETLKTFELLFGGKRIFEYPDSVEAVTTEIERTTISEQKALIEKLEKASPMPAKAMAVNDAAVRLVAVNVRGNHLQTAGSPVTRDIPRVLRTESEDGFLNIPDNHSGRMELAQWIASPANPLTARVIVNRVWQSHFGRGIVATASNFGFRGQPPSHPELLDWLANEFVAHDWSIKWLHRQIVLSSTYRSSTLHDAASEVIDPDNQWFWRQHKHRMEAEVLRDSLLSIGDLLGMKVGGEFQNPDAVQCPNLEGASNIGNMRRSLYLEVNRASMNDFLTTFDYVEPGVSVDKRSSTIVPHQSLFLMNHPMPQEIGRQLALRAHTMFANDDDRLRMVWKTILCREPQSVESQTIRAYLHPESARDESLARPLSQMNSPVDKWIQICRSLLLTNEFLYVE